MVLLYLAPGRAAAELSLLSLPHSVPWDGYLEGFLGVQGATVMAPRSARLDVPVRGSLGLQGRVGKLHLMLVARGGYVDFRSQWGARPTVDTTLSVGLWHFEEAFTRSRQP